MLLKLSIYLEGNWENVCKTHGINHITRTKKNNLKSVKKLKNNDLQRGWFKPYWLIIVFGSIGLSIINLLPGLYLYNKKDVK